MILKLIEEKLRKIATTVGKNARISSVQRMAEEADADALLLALLNQIEKQVDDPHGGYSAMLHMTLEYAFFPDSVKKAKQILEEEEVNAH